MWENSGQWSSSVPIERFYNAGLSADGRLCIATDTDRLFAVWSVDEEKQIWSIEEDDEVIDVALASWGKLELFEFMIEPVQGRYRLFGLEHNHPLKNSVLGAVQIKIYSEQQEFALLDINTKAEQQRLKYADSSGDWVFATFSDDGSTLAIMTPYDITFFRYHATE